MRNNRRVFSVLLIGAILTALSFSMILAEDMELIVKEGIFRKNKVWNIQFNTRLKASSLKGVNVYEDYLGKEKIEGVQTQFKDNNKNIISVIPPEEGYRSGVYYLIVDNNIHAENVDYNYLEKKLILKFRVESGEIVSIDSEKVMFKHYKVDDELREVETWVDNNKDKKVYDLAEEITEENIDADLGTYDVFGLNKVTADEVKRKIGKYSIPSGTMYNKSGQVLNSIFKSEVLDNRNMESIEELNEEWFGVITTRADLKSFPTDGEFHRKKGDSFDRIQETALEAGEAVRILHTSRDDKWYFVQGKNYSGWVKKSNVAKGNREKIKSFVQSEEFIVVLEDRAVFKDGGMEKNYFMGARLPIEYLKNDEEDFVVRVPVSDENGNLKEIKVFAGNFDYSIGYLDLSRENIIKQAFKLQGTPYSWGDKGVGRDCSSTMMAIYRTMGVELPRNTDEQEKSYGESTNLMGVTNNGRYEEARELKTGDLLFLKGHEVMYLGNYKGKDYIIHNFTGATNMVGDSKEYERVFRVGITPIDMLSGGGYSYMNQYTSFLKIVR